MPCNMCAFCFACSKRTRVCVCMWQHMNYAPVFRGCAVAFFSTVRSLSPPRWIRHVFIHCFRPLRFCFTLRLLRWRMGLLRFYSMGFVPTWIRHLYFFARRNTRRKFHSVYLNCNRFLSLIILMLMLILTITMYFSDLRWTILKIFND